MTVREFKAWLEGFGEAIDGSPTKRQWAKVKERLADVQEESRAREIVYRDRPYWWPTWYTPTVRPLCTSNDPIITDTTWTVSSATELGRLEASNTGSA